MILTAIKEFRIQHDVQLDILRIEWVGGPRMNKFQPAVEQLQKLAQKLQATRVLVEINSLPDIPVYDQIWLSTHFVPKVLHLPLARAVIILSSKRIYNHHVIEGLLAAVRLQILFDVQFFTQSEAAMSWLTDDSARLPALLAEWERAKVPPPAAKTPGTAEPRGDYHLQ